MLSKYKYHIYLFLIVIIGYWPFVFFQSALLHDNIDVALSTKFFASECYNNGLLPLWNPYQLFGFPAHADLQYTNWNLETLLVSLTFGYNYIVMHLLFILYLYLGALGMFLLSKHLSQSFKTALIISSVYVLSGIFSSHTQSLVTILGLVWLPYVMLYFLKWLNRPSFKSSILLIIFVYLFFTHGYQAFAFMILPILMLLFVINLYSYYKQKQNEQLKSLLFQSVFIIVCLCLLFSPIVISQIQSQNFVNRLNGMSVNDVMENPFPVLGLLSLINPLITIGQDALFNSEITMRNIFLGLIFFSIAFVSFFKKQKSNLAIVFLSFAILYVLASFGDVLPIRKSLYYVFPGFNLFRFPSLIRVVSILCVLCYVSIYYQFAVDALFNNKKYRNYFFSFLLSGLITVIVLLIFKINFHFEVNLFDKSFKSIVTSMPIIELLIYVSVVQFFIILILWIITNSSNTLFSFENKMGFAIVLEVLMMQCFYGQFTSFSELSPNDLQANFSKVQRGFPNLSKDAISENNYKFKELNYLWKNTGGFKKQLIVDDAWTSFYFSNYDQLIQHHALIFDELKQSAFVYGSKKLNHEFKITLPIDTSLNFISNTYHDNIVELNYNYKHVQPTHLLIDVITKDTVVLNTLQSYYTGWEASIDGAKTDLYWNAGLLMSVIIPPGKHVVTFSYSNRLFSNSLVISYVLFALLLVILIYQLSLKTKHKHLLSCLLLIIVLSFFYAFKVNNLKHQNTTSNTFITQKGITKRYDFNNKQDLFNCFTNLSLHSNSIVNYKWNNYYHSPEFWYALGVKDIKSNADLNKLSGDIDIKLNIKDKKTSRVDVYKELYIVTSNDFKDTLSQSIFLSNKNPYTKKINVLGFMNTNNELFGVVVLKAKLVAKPVVCIVFKDKYGEEKIMYFELNRYLIANDKWQKIPFYFNFNKGNMKLSELSLFMMNQNNNEVEVKDLYIN